MVNVLEVNKVADMVADEVADKTAEILFFLSWLTWWPQ